MNLYTLVLQMEIIHLCLWTAKYCLKLINLLVFSNETILPISFKTGWTSDCWCMLLVPVIIPFVKQDWESASRNLREWDEKDFLLRSSSLTSMTEMPNPAGFYSFVMPRPPGTNCEARRSVSISTAIHLSKMLLRFLIKSPLAHARLYYCSAVYYFVFIVWSRFF